MNDGSIFGKSGNLYEWIWLRRLQRRFTPHAGLMGDGTRLRLLLGVDGNGVKHLARLITHEAPEIRFLSDPLERFEPRLYLNAIKLAITH